VSELRLVEVTKTFGDHAAVDNLNLTVEDGEFLTLLGASGSGKTTCLRMVAGFVAPDAGRVFMGKTDCTALPPHRRSTGMVFQHYALFPHLTVAENVQYGLKARRTPRQEMQERTREVLRLVHLESLADRYPGQLSGGQQQRVALARAVVIRPSILLLDEPLSALDLKLRGELQSEIRHVQQSLGITTLFVTHDQSEALGMSDRVAVMRDGKILQLDTPVEVYQRPNCRYVANFVGITNFLDVVIRGQLPPYNNSTFNYAIELECALPSQGPLEVKDVPRHFSDGERCLLCIRPENIHLANGTQNRLASTVSKVTFSGDRWIVDCLYGGGKTITVSLSGQRRAPNPGEAILVEWEPNAATLLSDAD
jgi:ABC-type Fe3+/spermidine/putrescine transport system ATPase subunit